MPERGSGRVLNFRERAAGVPPLLVCPRCSGQAYDRGSCGLCRNFGYLLERDGERLTSADAIQIAATFAVALDLDLRPATPRVRAARKRRAAQ